MELTRLCACGCGASLGGMRVDAVYAGEACRKRRERAERADKARTRRSSRNGRGTRLYITGAELALVGRALGHLALPSTSAGERFQAKLFRARERVARQTA